MIKSVIFDCFGVLTTDSWREFVDNLPSTVDKTHLVSLNRLLDSGYISYEEFNEQVQLVSGRKPPKVENLSSREIVKNNELLMFVKSLKDKSYNTAILSNISTSWITDTFLNEEEQKYFDEFVFSYQVQLLKPNPDIFALTCSRLGVKPEEAVFTDDSKDFCDAASNFGIKAVHYRDNKQAIKEISNLIGE